jgi:hypothetical protein
MLASTHRPLAGLSLSPITDASMVGLESCQFIAWASIPAIRNSGDLNCCPGRRTAFEFQNDREH